MNANSGRHPFLDPVRTELHRAKWIWSACCFSPIIYFLVARAIYVWWFRDAAVAGFLHLGEAQVRFASQLFLGYIVALQASLIVLRRWFNRRALAQAKTLFELMAAYLKRTLVLLALSEGAVLGGFLYFVMVGDLKAVLIGGVFSYLLYAQSYPSEEGLARLARRMGAQ